MFKEVFIPYRGFRYYSGDVSILLGILAGASSLLTDRDSLGIFRILNEYLRAVRGLAPYPVSNDGIIHHPEDFAHIPNTTLYKFISDHALDCMLKGTIRLGSIENYQTIEHPGSRDEIEGACNLRIITASKSILTSVMSGFNYWIFCGTDNLENMEIKQKRFGTNIIKIKNVKSFAEEMKTILGAKGYHLSKIKYSHYKVFRASHGAGLDCNSIPPSDEFIAYIHKHAMLPSLYIKPKIDFEVESELRLVFEMPYDVKGHKDIPVPEGFFQTHIEVL